MREAQTPEQALDIAAAATRDANRAAALPGWAPVAAGVSGGLGAVLLVTVLDDGANNPLTWIEAITGIALVLAYLALVRWMRLTQLARGVLPTPVSQWKQEAVPIVVLLAVPMLGLAVAGLDGWRRVLTGAILGGWIWYVQARPQIAAWKQRSRTPPWKH
ncbi:hypothetical protein [Nocardia sp. NPDC020380]|uniref:hypothetical protein n=1 Tax=Nocardia sp. NPDC020380 TaxID=3364309 RepID=UPI0037AE92F6